MKSDDVCSIVAMDVLMLSWFDLLLLATRPYTVTTGTKARAWSAASVLPLLIYCCCTADTVFVVARLRGCLCKKKSTALDCFVRL